MANYTFTLIYKALSVAYSDELIITLPEGIRRDRFSYTPGDNTKTFTVDLAVDETVKWQTFPDNPVDVQHGGWQWLDPFGTIIASAGPGTLPARSPPSEVMSWTATKPPPPPPPVVVCKELCKDLPGADVWLAGPIIVGLCTWACRLWLAANKLFFDTWDIDGKIEAFVEKLKGVWPEDFAKAAFHLSRLIADPWGTLRLVFVKPAVEAWGFKFETASPDNITWTVHDRKPAGKGSWVQGIAAEFARGIMGDFEDQVAHYTDMLKTATTPGSPQWKAGIEKTLNEFTLKKTAELQEFFKPEKLGKSPLTPEEAYELALSIAPGITAIATGFAIAHAMAEAASFGQYEALKDLWNMIFVDFRALRPVQDLFMVPYETSIRANMEHYFRSLFRPFLWSRDDVNTALLRNNIEPERWRREYAWYGQSNERQDAILENLKEIPGPADLVRFLVKEVITVDQFASLMSKQGFGFMEKEKEKIQIYTLKGLEEREVARTAAWFWTSHWIPPGKEELHEMLARGLIDDATHAVWLGIIDTDPRMIQNIRELRYRLPTRTETRIVHEIEPLDDKTIKFLIEADRVHPDYVPKLINWVKNFQSRIFRRRFLLALEAAFRKDRISEEDLRKAILDAKYSSDVADWIVKTAKLRKELSLPLEGEFTEEDFSKAEIFALFRFGITDPTETRKLLSGKGYGSAVVDLLMKLAEARWSKDAPAPELALTKAEIRQLFLEGILEEPEIREELTGRGYPVREVNLLIRLWTSKLPTAAPPPEAALTKGEILDLWTLGELTDPEAQALLGEKGFEEREIDLLQSLKEFRNLRDERTRMRTQLLADYTRGLLTDAELEVLLNQLAYTQPEVQLYLAEARQRYRRKLVDDYVAVYSDGFGTDRMTLEQFQAALDSLPLRAEFKLDLVAYLQTKKKPAEAFEALL